MKESMWNNSSSIHCFQTQQSIIYLKINQKKSKVEEIPDILEESTWINPLKKTKDKLNPPRETPVQFPKIISKKIDNQETEMTYFEDPRIQAVIAIIFRKMDEVQANMNQQFEDPPTWVNRFENKITCLANKVKSISAKPANSKPKPPKTGATTTKKSQTT